MTALAQSGAAGGRNLGLPEPVLAIESLDFAYGPVPVLRGVSLSVHRNARAALLGTNGAGKSTLLRLIGGLARPTAGRILYEGEDITSASPRERVRRGLTLVEGGRGTFASLTVRENIELGGHAVAESGVARGRVDEALDIFPQLRPLLRRPAGVLSGGEQQMVAVARALVAGAQTLLIDELSLGLAPVALGELVCALDEVMVQGRTLLLVEQSLNVAMKLCTHAFFMEKGEVRFDGPVADLVSHGDLARSVFLGGAADRTARRRRTPVRSRSEG